MEGYLLLTGCPDMWAFPLSTESDTHFLLFCPCLCMWLCSTALSKCGGLCGMVLCVQAQTECYICPLPWLECSPGAHLTWEAGVSLNRVLPLKGNGLGAHGQSFPKLLTLRQME